MERAAKLARCGNTVLGGIAGIFILLMLLYGGYSLWDTYMVYQAAFVSDDLMKFKPVPSKDGSNPTLEELQAINPDVRGWLTIDDTHIDYPVVQGKTDLEYINKDVYGKFAFSGSIFLSCLNSPDFSDGYNLVYGHHMDNGGMFGDVVEFLDKSYFEKHTTGTLYLPGETYGIKIFACVETDAYDSTVFQPQSQPKDDISNLLEYLRGKSVQYREIGVEQTDRVIALSTCAEAETNGRVIIFGRLEKNQVHEGGVNN